MSAGVRRLRWPLLGAVVLVAVAGTLLALANPFANAGGAAGETGEGATATSLATVTRRSLSSQTQVDGTLGYAGTATIVLPAGVAPADVLKARQAVEGAEAALAAARTTLAGDSQALADARATLAADRRKRASDCAGDAAAGDAPVTGQADGSGGSTPCAASAQAVATDEQNVTSALGKVTGDAAAVSSSRLSLASARQSLAAAEASAVANEAGALFTALPSTGRVIERGGTLYAVGGRPVFLLYGTVPAWRTLRIGVTLGPDVAALNANLRALGFGSARGGSSFTSGTATAVRALQAAHRLPQTGVLTLGAVAFRPAAVRVAAVLAKVGTAAQAGPVLTVSSTRLQAAVALDATQQSAVKAGEKVTITLPDARTTPGVVSSVGKVASPGMEGGPPTVAVTVRLTDPDAAGGVDQAPVQVSITTASVKDVLAAPVTALLALAGGGYAVETVDAAGAHKLVAVTSGLFDDVEGLVELDGAGLRAGQRVVVPS
jgi:peptidoglycan hydrolase-like protein with peptidoglycan-binding domain